MTGRLPLVALDEDAQIDILIGVGSSNLDPFSLLLSLEANIVVDDETFAGTLKQSIETAITDGARQVQPVDWKTQPVHQQIKRWISYGLARFITGMTGYAPDTQNFEFQC